jgi:HAD superfamily hydrolase (TIGR01662 family)
MSSPTPEIVITVGYPGSGKGTYVKPLLAAGYQCFNRDTVGGSTSKTDSLIYRAARAAHAAGCRQFVFDNTYGTIASREPVIALGKELGIPVSVLWLQTTLEQAQVFAARRQIQQLGKLLRKDEYKAQRGNPNMFPPGAQYAYRKRFEPPTLAEGFAVVTAVEIETVWGPEYTNRAVILDLDGTVRVVPDHKVCPWPRDPSEVNIIDGCGALLQRKQREGFLILCATNQSGVSRKPDDDKYVSEANVVACIDATAKGLGVDIDCLYSTDRGGPPSSFWRKPCPGMGVVLIEKYKLDPSQCVYVGDMTSDKTFAERCGFGFAWAADYFR